MKLKLNINSKKGYLMMFTIITLIGIYNFSKNNKNQIIQTFKEDEMTSKKFIYPLGTIVGIKANTDGVLVLGYEEDDIEYIGGVKKGDNIVAINGMTIKNSKDILSILNKIKQDKIEVTFERNNKYKKEIIKTKKIKEKYKLGLWVRDKISGIGTMSFYDPNTKKFKAIGHPIVDVDTNELLKINQGYVYNLSNISIIKTINKKVGKIEGDFTANDIIGKFNDNSNFGISGELNKEKEKDIQLVEVASFKDVKLGDAIILLEDQNRNIQSYDVKIESIDFNKRTDKDMIIKVIDEDLIKYTGGIIQGMSGCPIIQNNRIIGTITHVFKDNPKKGYGIFIGKMIE